MEVALLALDDTISATWGVAQEAGAGEESKMTFPAVVAQTMVRPARAGAAGEESEK